MFVAGAKSKNSLTGTLVIVILMFSYFFYPKIQIWKSSKVKDSFIYLQFNISGYNIS